MRGLVLISYDITEDKPRRRLQKLLSRYGERVQYSVFECWADDARLAELLEKAGKYVRGEFDSLRAYRLCGNCARRVSVIGWGAEPSPPPAHWVV